MRLSPICGAVLLFSVALWAAACGPAPESEPEMASPLATPAAGMAGEAPTRASPTKAFVARAVMSRRIEIEASRIALRRADHPLVRQFARTTQRDAEESLRSLDRLATAADAPAPAGLDAPTRAAIEALRASDSQSFDAHYLDAVIRARAAAIDELERYAQGGADGEFRAFAADALPTLRARLQEADTLRQSVNLGAAEKT